MSHTVTATFLASLLITTATAAQNGTEYLVCMARNRENTAGAVTGVVTISASNDVDAQTAWAKEATSKYGADGSTQSCQRWPSVAAGEDARKQLIDQMKDNRLKVTEATWTYAGPKASAATPAAPATPEEAAKAEMPLAQGYCEHNMQELRTLFGCDCFAKSVYKYRLAHPNDLLKDMDHPHGIPRPVHDLVGGIPNKLDCVDCLTDEHIDAYLKEMLTVKDRASKAFGKLSVSDAVFACTKKAFTQRVRAEPYPDRVQATFNNTEATCAGSKP